MAVRHSVSIETLGALFDGDTRFRLPWFQRAYCWRSDEALRLLDDVLASIERDPAHDFCLGTIMLATSERGKAAAIVDGHQRIMTLTILFSVLRDLEPDQRRRTKLDATVNGAAGFLGRGEAGPHLEPPPSIRAFVLEHVQARGATSRPADLDAAELSGTERNIIDIRDAFRRLLETRTPEQRRALGAFLLQRATVVVRAVSDEDEAWRMLEVEEQTRMNFAPADIAKSTLLDAMPRDEREAAAAAWDACQDRLGQADMHRLLGLVRTLSMRKRREAPVESDLSKQFRLDQGGAAFIGGHLTPMSDALTLIRARLLGGPAERARCATSLQHLEWLDRDAWLVPLANWILKRGAEAPATADLLFRLERLTWLSRIAGVHLPRFENICIAIAGEIDRGAPPSAMRSLSVPDAVRSEASKLLRSPRFDEKDYAVPLLKRITVELGGDLPPPKDASRSIEHVHPKNPRVTTRGRPKTRPEEDGARDVVHTLGNLAFLTKEDNAAAENRGWKDKRRILAGSHYALAREAATRETWNAEVIRARTEHLVSLLAKAWEIELL